MRRKREREEGEEDFRFKGLIVISESETVLLPSRTRTKSIIRKYEDVLFL